MSQRIGEQQATSPAPTRRALSRRNCCSARRRIVAAATLTSERAGASAEGAPAAQPHRRVRPQAEHPRHLRRRHRPDQRQRLFVRPDGLPHAEHRPHRQEGMIFTDYYAEQSCTAGRSSFITGQCTLRTGLSKVGVPGADRRPAGRGPDDRRSCSSRSATRPASSARTTSATGTSILPTVHGFDEFFGNLYHLNAEEEPENRDYPKDPNSEDQFGPRGVLQCKATDRDDPTDRSALGQGRQADHRGHRPAHQEADGDDRRRDLGRRHRLHQAAGAGQQAVLLLVQHDPHARPSRMCGRIDRSGRS